MESCVKGGLAKSIGISNYNSEQTQRLLDNCHIKPAVNQVRVLCFSLYYEHPVFISCAWSSFHLIPFTSPIMFKFHFSGYSA